MHTKNIYSCFSKDLNFVISVSILISRGILLKAKCNLKIKSGASSLKFHLWNFNHMSVISCIYSRVLYLKVLFEMAICNPINALMDVSNNSFVIIEYNQLNASTIQTAEVHYYPNY